MLSSLFGMFCISFKTWIAAIAAIHIALSVKEFTSYLSTHCPSSQLSLASIVSEHPKINSHNLINHPSFVKQIVCCVLRAFLFFRLANGAIAYYHYICCKHP
jgi:hypothetical protein